MVVGSFLVWTAIVVAWMLLFPPAFPPVGCWGSVAPPPECLQELRAVNEEFWRTTTLPMLVVAAGGYLIVAGWAVRAWWHRRGVDRTDHINVD